MGDRWGTPRARSKRPRTPRHLGTFRGFSGGPGSFSLTPPPQGLWGTLGLPRECQVRPKGAPKDLWPRPSSRPRHPSREAPGGVTGQDPPRGVLSPVNVCHNGATPLNIRFIPPRTYRTPSPLPSSSPLPFLQGPRIPGGGGRGKEPTPGGVLILLSSGVGYFKDFSELYML